MKFYAIRHKSTGHFIPARKSHKGFTRDEPQGDCIPRLFKKKQHAASALHYYLKGIWSYKYSPASSAGPGEWHLDCQHVAERRKEEIEIVEVSLIIQ